GTAFTAAYSVGPAGLLNVLAGPFTAAAVNVGGAPRVGETFSITLTVGTNNALVSYTAVAGDDAADIAAALANALNVSADPDAASFTAASRDNALFVVNRS